MTYGMAILILLLVLKLIEQHRQILQMKGHSVLAPHKSVLVKHDSRPEVIEGSRVWIIPRISVKRAP
jgi:hypothetical protein